MNECEELLLDALWQACGEDEDGTLDTRGLAAYEDAAKYLVKINLLEKNNSAGRIYFLVREKDLKDKTRGELI